MATGSLCMLISNPRFSFVEEAVKSILRVMEFEEILLGVSAKFKQLGKVLELFKKCPVVKVLPGAQERYEMARARWGLFDAVSSEWAVVLDDDDVALGPISLDVPPEVGMIHSDILAICLVDSGRRKAGDTFIRESQLLMEPENCAYFRGSYWAIRKRAWEGIRDYLDDSTNDYEDWKVAWHVLKTGWKDHHIPKVLQVQRLRDFVAAAHQQTQIKGVTWEQVCVQLEQTFNARNR